MEQDQRKREVTDALARLARLGPIPSTGKGDMAVGKTLMDHLGISQETARKPTFRGMVITARRNTAREAANRVNLFAMVPDWELSECKSSEEIVEKYGYDREGGRKLYVSVRARVANAQGLFLEIDRDAGLLREKYRNAEANVHLSVASWRLSRLQNRLSERHPASAWVTANVTRQDGRDYFHYRYVKFTDAPRLQDLPILLEQGIVTLDHLIFSKDGRTVEKGPLFKISPNNIRALFPESARIDLMAID